MTPLNLLIATLFRAPSTSHSSDTAMTTTLPNNAGPTQDSGPLHYQDASTLAALIATKQASSREVVQAHLDRIAEVNPKINAIVTLLADDALRNADAADAAVASGAELGPRHGVPVTVKDALDTAAIPTQYAPSCSPVSSPTPTPLRWHGSRLPPREDQPPRVLGVDRDRQPGDGPHQQPLESGPHPGWILRRGIRSDRGWHVADRHRQ
jgi:hypothetical protein